MLKKIKLDTLNADLNSIEIMLSQRTEEDDPIGYFQFEERRNEVLSEIESVSAVIENHAAVGVFFGGKPVVGSRGIEVDFAGKILDDLQSLVSKTFAEKQLGALGQRGPLKLADSSQLLVTDVARGSFGFILEESDNNENIIETPLKETVEKVVDTICRVASKDLMQYEDAISSLDERILVSLKQFFQRLDDSEATVRFVEGEKDFLLDREAISLAKERALGIQISETFDRFSGILYLLPEGRRFELVVNNGENDTTYKGGISQFALSQLKGQEDVDSGPINISNVPGRRWEVELAIRKINENSKAPRNVYTLKKFINLIG